VRAKDTCACCVCVSVRVCVYMCVWVCADLLVCRCFFDGIVYVHGIYIYSDVHDVHDEHMCVCIYFLMSLCVCVYACACVCVCVCDT